MCSETFLRLPEEKRNRFLEAAWEEFTHVKFAEASINQIVHRAGIPRGSFYQYFTDKEELFSYLVESVQANAVRLFGELFHRAGGDLFWAMLLLYDSLMDCGREDRPMLNRCFQLLQVNPGIDLQKLLSSRLRQDIPQELWAEIDTSRMIRQDRTYVRRVFLMALGVLGRTIMDTLLEPEQIHAFRRELEENLEIIKYGSLRSERAAPAK